MVKNSYELLLLLEKLYKDRFSGDAFMAMRGRIEGTIDFKRIIITYEQNNYLLISTDANAKNLFNELTPLFNKVMKANAICSYNLQLTNTKEKNAMPTLEWDVKDPEARIRDIVNGRAFDDHPHILNLTIYNGKTVDDYTEPKIYGIYPGCIKDVDKILNLDEIGLYLAIDALWQYIWKCKDDIAYDRISDVDLSEEEYALEYLISLTRKFGVELNEPAEGKHIQLTTSFESWYHYYSNHFKNVLTPEEWNEFLDARANNEYVKHLLPQSNWKDAEAKLTRKLK